MLVGVFDLNGGACAEPENAVLIARLAEDLGFDSLWIGEHVVVPSPRVPPSPLEPTQPMIDPMVSLAFLAGVTHTIKLATGIVILPQREPVVLAKQVASLDVVSNGRLILGLGVGYLEPEFRAIGVPLEGRGRRATEYLGAMQQLWRAGAPTYEGTFVRFSGIDAYPRPVQRPWPPIIIGGRSAAAYRRAQLIGNGWYGWGQDVAATRECLEGLRAAALVAERPVELGPLEITLTPPKGAEISADEAAEYAALGVDRLVVNPPAGADIDEVEAYVRRHAPETLGLERAS
jgi:probable F420-dependent oxidoreductase